MSSSNNRLPAATKGGTGTVSTPANSNSSSAPPHRRSSASGQGLFSGLMNQKRNSLDATATARKASFTEQQPKPGFLGSIWNNYTKGGASSSAK
ncbi:MAG: hypothetical protein M1837_006835 [Sclerophora amabilis]|nr:MAG: hypothetical protein M1837_006835 [Sclerophora amabilis]